ncbi:MAG: hypothetical protein QF491_10545 [Alphaproteobacteria bacterium]|nr:hypothetical protein [Alphaproteobacteria bacterium]
MSGRGSRPAAGTEAREGDRGTVLIAVSFVGIFAMALCAALISSYAVSEARAVEDSLAKLRVYWAMMGHVDYALSRARGHVAETPSVIGPGQASLCDTATATPDTRACVDDPDSVSSVAIFLGELATGADCKGGDVSDPCATWSYANTSAQYQLHFIWAVADAPYAVPVTTDGRVGIRIDYADQGDERDYANWLDARLVREGEDLRAESKELSP